MAQPLRVLLLEDRPADAELVVRELRRAGFEPEWRRADTEAAFLDALGEWFDVILADYRLPQFDGLQALRLVRERRLDVPVIVVTGTLGEELAVECVKRGAADFVRKDHLDRLGRAVTRALEERRLRRENERAYAELRAAHAGLVESQTRYRSLFDNLLNGYARCRMIVEHGRPADWIYLEVNPSFETLTGLKDVVGKRVTEVIPGLLDAHPELLEIYGRVARGGPPERFDMFVKPLGIWLSIAAYHAADEHFVAVFDNISERKRAEESLRESRASLEVAILASNLGPWDRNLVTNEVSFSSEWKRQIGYANEEISNAFSEWEGRLHPDDHDRTVAAVDAYLADPSVGYNVEFRLRHKDGSYRWIRTGGTLVYDAAGRPVRLLGCHVDVTDHRQALAERERLSETMRLVLESTGEGLYGIDASGRCTLINRSGAEALGAAAGDLIGQHMHTLMHHTRADGSPYPVEECPVHQTCVDGASRRVDGEVFWRRDGTSFPVGYSSYPIVKDGIVSGAVVSFADVTDRLVLEAQLRQSQKLEAIGQLTGGVAHDFNNLLTAILGYARLIEESLEAGDVRRDDVAEIRNAGERAAHLTQQLLAFSRRQVLQPQVIDLNTLVAELVQMLRRLIGEGITLTTSLAGDLRTTTVDPGQMQQVIMNLVVNARDAMPDGGTLAIDTTNETLGDAAARSHAVAPGEWIRLSVSDSGSGMDEPTMRRIFEPFFTTKPSGQGTGLGLSTVYGIVKQSGGFIQVTSAVGQGSEFVVYLPAAGGPAAVKSGTATAVPMRGIETILLVEDDAGVRTLAQRMLERRGFTVIAVDGPVAARAASAGAERIDLLLTDVQMPDSAGPALYRELAAARPGLKVVFMSGYSDESSGLREGMAGHVFLRKPFDNERLVEKVREALDAAGGMD